MIIERTMVIIPVFVAAVCSLTSISLGYGQIGAGQGLTEFLVSAKGPNPQTTYKVCGGLMGETDANLGCQSLTGATLQQYGWQFRILDFNLDYQKTKLYGCIIDDTTNMSFCDSVPLPAAGGSSQLSIDLNQPSKMPLPAHFDQEPSDESNLEEDSEGSENNDNNDEEEENE